MIDLSLKNICAVAHMGTYCLHQCIASAIYIFRLERADVRIPSGTAVRRQRTAIASSAARRA
jgi:hypothetical protein